MVEDDPREEVVLAGRVLAQNGHADMVWGHVSLRDRSRAGFWIKGAGWGLDEVTADDIQLVGLDDGRLIAGSGSVHLEHHIHSEVLRARPDVACVIHTHPESAVAFATLHVDLLPLAHEGTLFGPPDIARFEQTSELISTPALGRAVADALGDRNALLLVNHGVVVVGRDVGEAVLTAVLLEKACRMQLLALAASQGRSLVVSSDEEALRKRASCYSERQMQHGWEYLKRRSVRPPHVG